MTSPAIRFRDGTLQVTARRDTSTSGQTYYTANPPVTSIVPRRFQSTTGNQRVKEGSPGPEIARRAAGRIIGGLAD